MTRLLVNDSMSQLGERTFWVCLQEWFDLVPVLAPFDSLAEHADTWPEAASLIVRNASWFPPLKASETIPTISILQDIFTEGPAREMQEAVMASSEKAVFNSRFTRSKYGIPGAVFDEAKGEPFNAPVIPLPVDFSVFEPGNPMGLQQSLSLPDGCVCWVGACQGAAGHVKGWDIFLQIVRLNPDIPFVGVFKDAFPDSIPPNMRCYVRLTQEELAKVMGACRVGLCTSRMESQHLAGIEMGACGLKLVVPDTGIYWRREDLPIWRVVEPTPQNYAVTIRGVLAEASLNEHVRGLWQKEFDREVIRKQWEKLVEEVDSDPT